ncbi:MAG: LPS export ABC transporter permease LptF [Methylovulum sp.]|uniref:LPS export ABC transporter permease LptF n=1 Tax=Methylovulum sp. TaxID=1916980 RepID=UPI00263901CF|nr:LPS export ABC transporter permease LptF [Methylovulum sp.]MDD2724101.1 LPS export ABC transporter permease LptF [Methylovulum sp.]MDD5124727.1 LPS export ABC transporter permease LptF [Methylovulum sp.]
MLVNCPKVPQISRMFTLTVLDRLIAQDLLKTLLSVWSVIVVIIVSREFIRVLDKAIQGRVSSETLMTLLALKTISIGVSLLPAALFMAVLMVLGKMYRDQEMSAVASAGGGVLTLYRAVFLLVFPLSVVAAGLSLYTTPWAEAMTTKIMHEGDESADLRGIAAGKFSEYSQSDLVFYVEDITDDNVMHDVFVQHRQAGTPSIITADSARLRNLPDGRYAVFYHGERVQGVPGNLDFVIEKFTEYAIRVEEPDTAVFFGRTTVAPEILWSSSAAIDNAELQRRWSIPLGLVLLSFLGVPLAQISPRGGAFGNILTGFVIYFCYGNLLRVSQLWVTKEVIPGWLGGLAINLLLLVVGAVLLARLYGWRWLYLKLRQKATL